MMAADTAIRIASPGTGGKIPAEPPGGESRDFPAALSAVGSGRATTSGSSQRDDHGAVAPQARADAPAGDDSPGDERDARAGSADPALAAALAALFPGAAPVTAAGTGSDEGRDLLLQAIAARSAGASTGDGTLDAQLDAALDMQPALPGDGVDPDVGQDLLKNLARELAMARDPAVPLRAGTDARVLAPGEAVSGSAATHAATQLAGLTATTVAAAATAEALRQPVGTPRWADELGSRLVHMSMRGQHEASLTLAPEHLGPLEVRISMNQNTAHVWFGAQHADTRAALAEALPRLREMLADAGLSLGNAGVSHEAPGRDADRSMPLQPRLGPAATQAAAAPQDVRRPVSGLLDLYA